ncbi:serine hydrolase domain-containing protein [Tranquillimonas alkanivorans]|uniref:CubicO group peptidase, beta-lactamase class C family n=1 Tax=Tranquillimonas alkanivorans TaxID=441119 RepID=A0A1I5KTD3_9RHOB|nr:serine hydrolase [Tranquillimonas alkanivorans]SFO87661.1 CubicO group peptidase, beta-lactamase class C family [Tranquillimonas alkanivorans]
MTQLTRRTVIAGLLATAATPLLAQEAPFAAALERAREFEQLHSLTIAVDGRTHVDRAIRGPALGRIVNVKSVSKSIVSALVGIAIARGHLDGVNQPIAPLLERELPTDLDPLLSEVTIGDLLSMRAGLERTSGGNYGAWVSSSNWVRDALARPFVADPGGRMLYSTGNYHILGAILSRVTGDSLLTLARNWLGDPLGIAVAPWVRDPQGRYLGGNDMGLTATGLLRFGETYRQGGTWNGTRVLPESWVEASWTPRARSPWSGDAYGYGWFLSEMRGHPTAYARGYGGQAIWVIRDLGLTVVVTSDPNRPARSEGYMGDLHDMVASLIVPEAQAA